MRMSDEVAAMVRLRALGWVAVGTRVALRPPHRSVRAGLPHTVAWCTDRLVGAEELGGVGERPLS